MPAKYIIIFLLTLVVIIYIYIEYNLKLEKSKNILNIINDRSNVNDASKIKEENLIVNTPFLPDNDDIIKKKINFTYYNSSNIRYHFPDIFYNRKIFKINYSYMPYEKIDTSKSYEENAEYIFQLTGMLNITKLDIAYRIHNPIDMSDFNHIHLSMGHDTNYILLSLVTIASILNTTNKDTFIHFHFVLVGSNFKDMKPIISLKKIYQNVDFIFYNGKQVEYDFFEYGKKEIRGLGDYAKFLIPEIVNNTNKIIILDSADIIAKKDLSEIYFFDLEDNYFGFALDIFAGKSDHHYVFSKNKLYGNIGACIVNIRKFRKDNLYMAGYFARLAYSYLPCPTQEMFFLVSQYKFKFLPLIYNCPQFFNSENEFKNKIYNTTLITKYLHSQRHSPFSYSLEEIIEAESNQVINHLFTTKPYHGLANKKNGKNWVNYAKLANISEKLQLEYPHAFSLYGA